MQALIPQAVDTFCMDPQPHSSLHGFDRDAFHSEDAHQFIFTLLRRIIQKCTSLMPYMIVLAQKNGIPYTCHGPLQSFLC